MIKHQENWVEKIFPELKPDEVEQVRLNLEEFLNNVLDCVIELNNKSEDDHTDKNHL